MFYLWIHLFLFWMQLISFAAFILVLYNLIPFSFFFFFSWKRFILRIFASGFVLVETPFPTFWRMISGCSSCSISPDFDAGFSCLSDFSVTVFYKPPSGGERKTCYRIFACKGRILFCYTREAFQVSLSFHRTLSSNKNHRWWMANGSFPDSKSIPGKSTARKLDFMMLLPLLVLALSFWAEDRVLRRLLDLITCDSLLLRLIWPL